MEHWNDYYILYTNIILLLSYNDYSFGYNVVNIK